MRATELQACELLGWDELKYRTYLFECGMMYLDATLEPWDARAVSQERVYWGWWRNEWEMRERAWLDNLERQRCTAREKSMQMIGLTEIGNNDAEKALSACFGNYGSSKRPVSLNTDVPQEAALAAYKKLHNPHVLAEAITLDGEVLEESYSRVLIPMLNGGK